MVPSAFPLLGVLFSGPADPERSLRLKITGGNTVVTGNLLENVVIEVNDEAGEDKPILIEHNVMENSIVDYKKGNLKPSP